MRAKLLGVPHGFLHFQVFSPAVKGSRASDEHRPQAPCGGRGVQGGRARSPLTKRVRVELPLYLDVDMDMFPLRIHFTPTFPAPLKDAGF